MASKVPADAVGASLVLFHLRIFLENKFLAWLEVLSVLGGVGGAAVALEELMLWLQEVCFGVIRCIDPQ